MIKLYHTLTCPQCKLVEKKLKESNIEFTDSTDIDEMTSLGFTSVPVLQVGEQFYQGAKNILGWIRTKAN